jgi:hypothetical protein
VTAGGWLFLDGVSSPSPGRPNEDAYGIRGDYAWVIDGATPLGGSPLHVSPAREFARALSRELASITSAETSGATPRDLIEQSLARLPLGGARADLPPAAAAAVIRRDADKVEYALMADVTLVVGEVAISDSRMASVNAEASDAVAAEVSAGASLAEARKRVEDLLIRQRSTRMNRHVADEYWVLTADPATANQVCVGSVERIDDEPVLLCSDGFARLVDDAREYEWLTLVQAASERGLAPLVGELRELEALDPTASGFVRLSPHDDATALLLR